VGGLPAASGAIHGCNPTTCSGRQGRAGEGGTAVRRGCSQEEGGAGCSQERRGRRHPRVQPNQLLREAGPRWRGRCCQEEGEAPGPRPPRTHLLMVPLGVLVREGGRLQPGRVLIPDLLCKGVCVCVCVHVCVFACVTPGWEAGLACRARGGQPWSGRTRARDLLHIRAGAAGGTGASGMSMSAMSAMSCHVSVEGEVCPPPCSDWSLSTAYTRTSGALGPRTFSGVYSTSLLSSWRMIMSTMPLLPSSPSACACQPCRFIPLMGVIPMAESSQALLKALQQMHTL